MNLKRWTGLSIQLLVCMVLVLACATMVAAQSTVTINGAVKDQSGAAVPGATVTATNVQTGIRTTAPTNALGFYSIVDIPAGNYDVQASQQGFATVTQPEQQLLVGTTVTLDFTLQVSSVAQTVSVQAVSPELEPTQSNVTSILTPAQLNDLPILSRNFSELAALTPGVQATSQISVGFSVGGAVTGVTIGNSTQYETGYMVDDIPIYKPSDGGLYVAMAQDWVQEFSVISSQASAQYPGAVSGVMNVVTRSGGNEIHGRAYGLFQNSALNASSFNPVNPVTSKTPTSSQRVGGMIGGPIIKHKLFYFGGYEYFRGLVGSVFAGIPASFAGSRDVMPVDLVPANFSNLTRQDLAMLKITYQINPTNSLNLIGNYQFINEPNPVTGGYISPLNGNSLRNGNYQESVDWQHVFSPTAINELRASTARDWDDEQCLYAAQVGGYPTSNAPLTPYGVSAEGNPTGYWASLTYPGAVPHGSVSVGCAGRWGGRHFIGLYGGVYENLTLVKGRHTITVGGNAEDPYYGSSALNSVDDGAYTFPATTTSTNTTTGLLGTNTGPFDPTNPLTFPQRLSMDWNPTADRYVMATGWSWGMFAQDTWRMTDSLTMNMGLRWDGDLSYSYYNSRYLVPGVPAVNNDFHTVSPRIGLAYAPGNKSTVFRGGFGLYYAPTTLTEPTGIASETSLPVIVDSFTSNSTAANPYCISPGGCGNPSTFASYQNDLRELLAWSLYNDTYPNLALTSVTLAGNTYSLPGFTGTIPKSIVSINPNLKRAAALQTTFGVTHSFSNGLSIDSNFVYIYGFDLDLFQNVNVNPQIPTTSAGGVNFVNPAFTANQQQGSYGHFGDKQWLTEIRYTDHRGDFGEVSYTLGWCTSNSAPGPLGDFAIHTFGYSTDPLNPAVDNGPCTTDQRDNVAMSGSVLLPGGIVFAPIVEFSTGLPLSPTTNLFAGQSATVGSVVVTTPGCQVYYTACYPARNGVYYGKGSLRGGDTISFNARVQRTFKLGERMSITPMFEAYDIPNIANLGTNYTTLATSPSFGEPSSATVTMRQLQLGVRFDF